jgi:hypothetical protein
MAWQSHYGFSQRLIALVKDFKGLIKIYFAKVHHNRGFDFSSCEVK